MKQSDITILDTIPSSQSDELLRQWGYDLTKEYLEVLSYAGFHAPQTILELATGTGRMSAVLARLGHNVITGDLTQQKRPDAEKRIAHAYLPQVVFMELDMERLPFTDRSVDTIVCMNTLHELEHPRKCLEEIIRIHSKRGTLIIGDFNELGFEVMQRLHQTVYKDDHSTGSLKMVEVEPILQQTYPNRLDVRTTLNISIVV